MSILLTVSRESLAARCDGDATAWWDGGCISVLARRKDDASPVTVFMFAREAEALAYEILAALAQARR